MDHLDQSAVAAVLKVPPQQGLQAGTEERRDQCTFVVVLDVNHRGRTGDQVVQPCMRGGSPLLLVLDVADVEHETDQPPLRAVANHLALHAIPRGRLLVITTAQAYR
ncbi:hypothetical protein D3C81_1565030 [compost metagenome]